MEKEAAAIVEALHHWRYFLLGRQFTVITDQKSIRFIYDKHRKSKIKNDKISTWGIELSQFKYEIKYRLRNENHAADTFSRIADANHQLSELRELHENLCHPGMTRLAHFVRTCNLPFSHEHIKTVTDSCKSCQYLKPKFIRKEQGKLVQAILPFQRLNVDFKGPLPVSRNGNRYLLTMIDGYS